MKRKLIAAGIASAFFLSGPVLAGGDKNVEKDASVNSRTDTSVSSSTATPLPDASVSNDTSASVGSSGASSGDTSANEPQKRTGLDRADEVAGEKGKHGRDNARDKQDRR